MVFVDYIGIFLHFRILLTDDCVCVQTLARNEFAKWRHRTYRYRVKCPYVVLS